MRASRAWVWGGLIGALALGALAFPWSLDPDLLATRLNAALPMPDGLRWRPPASATLALFPRPILDMYDMKLVNAAGEELLTVPAAAIALSPPRLLLGEFSMDDARLRHPTVQVDIDALAKQVQEAGASPASPMRRLRFNDARIHVFSRRLHLDETVTGVDAQLAWPKIKEPLRLSGAGAWGGHALSGEFRLDAPVALAAGGASGAGAKLSTEGLDLAYEGTWTTGAKPSFSGELTANLDSIRAAAAAFQYAAAASLPAYGAAFSGSFALAPGALSVADAQLTLAGQQFEGSGNLAHAPQGWMAAVTLAAERLDLTPLIGPPPSALDGLQCWSERPWRAPDPRLDLDLTLSATHTSWGALAVDDAALSLERKDGETKFKIIEAALGHGALTGELALNGCGDHCSAAASLSLANADLGALSAAFGVNALSGQGSVKLELVGDSGSPAEFAASAHGVATVELQNGAISGVSFEEALRRSQRRLLEPERDLTVGQTPFATANARFEIAGGVAEIAAARLDGPGAIVTAGGAIDLARCAWRAHVEAMQAGAEGIPSPDPAHLALGVSGPWSAPTLSAPAHSD